MKSKYLILVGLGLIIFAAIVLFYPKNQTKGDYDAFAQCLAEKKVTMYGAAWCAHCQAQKKEFGESFKFVPYVECPADPQKCLAAGVTGYPTWIFPASLAGGPDGKKLMGEQGLEKLSQESMCPLVKPNN